MENIVFNGKLFDIKILSLKSEYFNGLKNFISNNSYNKILLLKKMEKR